MKSNPTAVATRLVGARATAVLSQAFRWWKGFALSPRRIGLLIDGDSQRVAIARRVLTRDPGLKVTAVNAFRNVDNVDSVIASHFGDRALGGRRW